LKNELLREGFSNENNEIDTNIETFLETKLLKKITRANENFLTFGEKFENK
jgi:hypothetical protein